MATGTVKFFNQDKGFGFITPKTVEPMCSSTCRRCRAQARSRTDKRSRTSSARIARPENPKQKTSERSDVRIRRNRLFI